MDRAFLVRTDLIRLLQKHHGQKYITLSNVYAIRRLYRSRMDAVQNLFALAVQHGAGVIEGSLASAGTRARTSLRLRLTPEAMTPEQKLSLRVLTGGTYVQASPPMHAVVDLGGCWHGTDNACVPLHLAHSAFLSPLCTDARDCLARAAWDITEQTLPLDVTPRCVADGCLACPQSLRAYEEALVSVGGKQELLYVIQNTIVAKCWLGQQTGTPLLPLIILVEAKHCVLSLRLNPQAWWLWATGYLNL